MSAAQAARGSIWHFQLDPVVGSEQGKTRPCVIIQRDSANASSPVTIVCPLTDAKGNAGNLLNVPVLPPEGGVKKPSLVSCNQIRTLDRRRLRGQTLGQLSEATMARVEEGLRAILDL
jgi:mRNA interferase MazF